MLDLTEEDPSAEHLDNQVQKAQEQLLQLKRQAEVIEKQKRELEELSRRQEELERGTSSVKNEGRKIPLPGGLPPVTGHSKPVDNKISADDNDFGFKSSTIAPHSTAAGWLYYDIRDLGHALRGATIEVRKARWAATNRTLDTFEIQLQPASTQSQGNH